MPKSPLITVNIRLDPQIHKWLRRQALEAGVSMNQIIRHLLREHVQAVKERQPH